MIVMVMVIISCYLSTVNAVVGGFLRLLDFLNYMCIYMLLPFFFL